MTIDYDRNSCVFGQAAISKAPENRVLLRGVCREVLTNPATSENMVEQLGTKVAQFKHLALELSQVQALIEEDRKKAGFGDG